MSHVLLIGLSLGGGSAFAAGTTKTYQVTGPVLEVSDSKIVVQKGKERWELLRDASTKVEGELKTGGKVTISYTMTAVTAKADKAEAGDKAAKGK